MFWLRFVRMAARWGAFPNSVARAQPRLVLASAGWSVGIEGCCARQRVRSARSAARASGALLAAKWIKRLKTGQLTPRLRGY